jgi:hypothetical protein
LQIGVFAETKNLFTLTKGGGVMFSKLPISKVTLLLVLVLLVISIGFGATVLADGGGDEPYPPDQSLPAGVSDGGSSFLVTLLTVLQFVL